jgi:hypothetical protein
MDPLRNQYVNPGSHHILRRTLGRYVRLCRECRRATRVLFCQPPGGLSFSVFWMDRSSLGDRISVSFIGILTAVTYQLVMSEIQPRISYVTFMNGFLNISFFLMCATVVINLVVGEFDKKGKFKVGDRIDRYCRWIFPLTFFAIILLLLGVAFLYL